MYNVLDLKNCKVLWLHLGWQSLKQRSAYDKFHCIAKACEVDFVVSYVFAHFCAAVLGLYAHTE